MFIQKVILKSKRWSNLYAHIAKPCVLMFGYYMPVYIIFTFKVVQIGTNILLYCITSM